MLARSLSTDRQRLTGGGGRNGPVRASARERSQERCWELECAADEAGGLGVNAGALLGVLGLDLGRGAQDLSLGVDHGHKRRLCGVERRGEGRRDEAASRW